VAWQNLIEFYDDHPYHQYALPFLLKLASGEFEESKM
jgi:hypothetical protein